jgi:hypothetical protein
VPEDGAEPPAAAGLATGSKGAGVAAEAMAPASVLGERNRFGIGGWVDLDLEGLPFKLQQMGGSMPITTMQKGSGCGLTHGPHVIIFARLSHAWTLEHGFATDARYTICQISLGCVWIR